MLWNILYTSYEENNALVYSAMLYADDKYEAKSEFRKGRGDDADRIISIIEVDFDLM